MSLCVGIGLILAAAQVGAKDTPKPKPHPLASLKLRLLGPVYPSGRISDFAVDPQRPHRYFVAAASGGVWLTENDGMTYRPVFDGEASYAVGVVRLDPKNPNTVWAGTGENNSQRSVAWGDGVYRSTDGGASWKNLGLKNSGHISDIKFDPRDSNVVYVAAQGPLWNSGGDRGLYKTVDAGKTWKRVLFVDPDTGANEVLVHPERPDHVLVSTYQRRRHVWVLINGGPGSGLRKSTDGGKTWRTLDKGLPKVQMGRIGIAHSAAHPDTVYAIIEAEDLASKKAEKTDGAGIYKSTDFGETWKKISGHRTTSPQYYNELVVDPNDVDRVYSLDTFLQVSNDGGKNWERLGIEHRHVDDHALWIDPQNSAHLMVGGDGGIYESYDFGKTWAHAENLPLTQFYRIAADNEAPFYNVCGGTQDNNSLCAPVRTTTEEGIISSDWTIVIGGDGYEPQIDPTDPNIIYAQYQYGGLARYDRTTKERVFIAPQPGPDENAYRFNWNAPLLISPHNPKRLYFGAEKLFRSDDRGDSWTAVSPDLSQGIDRNRLKVMGRVWGVDTVAKNDSTSYYGSLIALTESPRQEGLLYVGTDDGLIHVTDNGGKTWTKISSLPGVPALSYIEDLAASSHDATTVYVVVDNHKRGDFKPYVLKSVDRGKSWVSIAGNLPARGPVHTIVEDHVDPDLLFVGTEFGLFFTQDGGKAWQPLKGGFPTISVRDLEIQTRESDLVVGTFGRGIYVLDDYSPLRRKAPALAATPATLFDVKDTWLYVQGDRFGGGAKGNRGVSFWQASNPPYGAVFTYYLRDGLTTRKQRRQKVEQERRKAKKGNPYPSWDALRKEDREEVPQVILTVRDESGAVVRRLTGPIKKGLHRVAWNLRYPTTRPVDLGPKRFRPPWWRAPQGPMVLPGKYSVSLSQRLDGEEKPLSGSVSFAVKPLERNSPLVTKDRAALLAFQQQTADLLRAIEGASKSLEEMNRRVDHLKVAVDATPSASRALAHRLRVIEGQLDEIGVRMNGDKTVASRNEPTPWPIRRRVNSVVFSHWDSQASVTGTHRRAYEIAAQQFGQALKSLRKADLYLDAVERELEQAAGPWTPGRIPDWTPSGPSE